MSTGFRSGSKYTGAVTFDTLERPENIRFSYSYRSY